MLGGSKSFDNRIRLIQTGRAKRGKGSAFVVDRNGVLITKPRRSRFELPIKGLFYLALGFAMFKALAMVQLGNLAYLEKVEKLDQGTVFEQAGAFLMAPDPVSVMIAGLVGPFLS